MPTPTIDKAYGFTYMKGGGTMAVINATTARARLFRLVDEVAESHEPVFIAGPRNNAVLISEEDWRSIEETLYLSAIPGLKESILAARQEPVDEMAPDDDKDW